MAQLYAIVGGMERARVMLEAEVPYLQLRFKGQPMAPYLEEIAQWPARHPATRLVVNDDLDFAIRMGAWGVHLGQEDLKRYSAVTLRAAPLAVGISTHSDTEIAYALQFNPALLGFGPVFATTTKNVVHPPQGVARLAEVVASQAVPIVAIGGIGEETLAATVKTGVPMIAMIAFLDRFPHAAAVRELMVRMAS